MLAVVVVVVAAAAAAAAVVGIIDQKLNVGMSEMKQDRVQKSLMSREDQFRANRQNGRKTKAE